MKYKGALLSNYDEMSHAGVLGMRWGHRKDRRDGDGKTKTIRGMRKKLTKEKEASQKQLKANSIAREKKWDNIYLNRSTISDAQMRQALNRLQLENQFAQQVKTAQQLTPTQAKKSVYQRMGPMVVTASKFTPLIVANLPKEVRNHKTTQQLDKAAKFVNNANSIVNQGKKKDKD